MFQWRSALAAKGEDPADGGARLHCGVTAQAVADAFEAEGLNARSYGVFCLDQIEDEGTGEKFERMGVRYDQLFAMALGASGRGLD